MRSTRLPGKVLRPLGGRPMLEVLIERVRRAPSIDEIVIATTDDGSAGPIVELANTLGVRVFCGSEHDVLARVVGAARSCDADLIVSLTGDNPLVDPNVIEQAIATYREGNVDYVSNTLDVTFPRGSRVQVFARALLEEVERVAEEPAHREHVTLYIYEREGRFRLRNLTSGLSPEATRFRLTVDTPEDFEVVSKVYEALHPLDPSFGVEKVVDFLSAHPDIAALNAHIQQKPVPTTGP